MTESSASAAAPSPSGSDATAAVAVEHDPARSSFVARVDGREGRADYRMAGRVMQLTHTEVPPPIAGRGIAAALIRAALTHAERNGLKVEPLCSYARRYMERHPQTHGLRA